MSDWHMHPSNVPTEVYVRSCPECVRVRRRPRLRPESFSSHMRQVVLWHLLIEDADAYSLRTGEGLAGLWGEIRRGDYETARVHLDRLLDGETVR